MARYALVIGIAQYPNSGLKPLPKAVTDAEVVAQVLEQYGDYKVIRLPARRDAEKNSFKMVDKTVSDSEVGQELKNLLLERAANSEVLIYYAGHGFTISDNLGRQKGFLATSNCQIETVEKVAVEQKDGISLKKPVEKIAVEQKYGISLESLNQLIQESELSSLVLLLDCCHSGYFLESQLVQQTLTAFSSQKNYYLITACRSFENAKSFKGEPHAIFTGALLKGLSIENAGSKGRVSGDRLFDFISEELKNSAEQEPIRLGWGQSITLVTYPQKEILLEPPPSSLAVHRENPYLGLRAFEDTEGDYFFGREIPVRVLVDRLKSGRFIAIIGPSGCGKSSLVKAGLLPKLKQNYLPGSSQWIVQSFTPGIHPLQGLEKALREQQQDKELLLFIDQFEELFTLCEDEEERKIFINRVTAEATNADRMTRIIVAMRGDFLDRCAAYQEIAILINRAQPTTYMVTQLTPAELEEAIEKPAEKQGVKFEWGLIGQIIADVINQPGALPLLQYALAELWRVCITGSTSPQPQLTHKCYEEIRGVRGALEKRANELYHNLAPADKYFVRLLFLELVQLGEGKEVTRRRTTWQDLATIADSQEQLQRVTRQLASQQERLIITDEKTVEVAHEALLSEWKLLQGWIEQDRENLRLNRRLKSECQEWEKNACSEGLLLTDAWLAAITDWVEKTQPRLSVVEREFLQKSLDKRERKFQDELNKIERELEQERKLRDAEAQKTKLAFRATVGLAMLVGLASGLAFWAKLASDKATRNEIKALTQASGTYLQSDKHLESLIAGVEALQQVRSHLSQVPTDLQAIIYKIRERNRLEQHTKEVMDVQFSLNGETIISTSLDGTIKIYNSNGKLLSNLKQLNNLGIESISLNPKEPSMIASSTIRNQGIITLWNITDQSYREIKPPNLQDNNYILHVSFSPDGKIIAVASWDKTVKLVRVTDGQQLQTLTGHNHVVNGLAFSPDCQTIASVSWDKTVKLWRVADGQLLHTLTGHDDAVLGVSFSPDNQIVASASRDATLKLWRVANGKLLQTLRDHNNEVNAVAFSRDGQMMTSASKDTTVKVWRVADGSLIQTFVGHGDAVNKVSFSPDNQMIASASDDKTVKLWSLKPVSSELNDANHLLIASCIWLKDYQKNNKGLLSAKIRKNCEAILM